MHISYTRSATLQSDNPITGSSMPQAIKNTYLKRMHTYMILKQLLSQAK